MKAIVGDRLCVHGHRVGESGRTGRVIEVKGPGGEPPYLVRWEADGHESLFFPGSDVSVERLAGGAPAEPVAPAASERHLEDPEVRFGLLEDGLESLLRDVEEIREDLRALAAAVREREEHEP